MPTNTVKFTPGVNSNLTPSLNQAAYQSTQLTRWDPGSGQIEKLGGWTKFYGAPIDSTVTALHPWEDLNGVLHLGIGATDSLDVLTEGLLQNITPQETTTNPAVNFSTTMGSAVVTIDDPGSNASIYDVINLNTPVSIGGIVLSGLYPVSLNLTMNTYEIIGASPATSTVASGGAVPEFTTTSGSPFVSVLLNNHGKTIGSTFPVTLPTTVGGIPLFGFYTVQTVTDANNFIFAAANMATASTSAFMNGGNAQIVYYITPGPTIAATGFGVGGYGDGGYGDGIPPTPIIGTPITAVDWTLDNFGGFLVACPNDGPIFVWQEPSPGLLTAQIIAQAPIANTGIFVASSAQIIFAYGSSVLGIQDPLLNRWCQAGDYTNWVASPTNLAGSFRLSKGSRIVGALQGPLYIVEWTDLDVWSVTFIGAPDVYSFVELATGCGLIGKFAAGVLGTTVYWMSQKQFFALPGGGSVVPLPCTVWDFIFQNLDTSNLEKIRCAPNSQFGEITWYFPVMGGNGKNSAYVKFTPQFNAWDYGFLGRSAWTDQSGLGPPIGAESVSNYLYQHETSNDADGVAMAPSFSTGYWALSDGEDIMFSDLTIPDFRWGQFGQSQAATVNISYTYADYAVGQTYSTPTYQVQSSGPNFINSRLRARLVSMTVSSNDLGSFWRFGGVRVRTSFDGRL